LYHTVLKLRKPEVCGEVGGSLTEASYRSLKHRSYRFVVQLKVINIGRALLFETRKVEVCGGAEVSLTEVQYCFLN
jgi:hypothetical protein